MANTSLILNNLDFDTLKNTLKAYLRSQDTFNDYDFDGSNMSVLLDLLSYNTFHNAFYLNMIGNEMFLDTAQLRDSVISHAKELNYTPRSFTSAVAQVTMEATTNNPDRRSITIPKGTTFTSRFGIKNYTFSTAENIVLTELEYLANGELQFTGTGIPLYEGYYVTDTYTYQYSNPQRILITNQNVDISSITVTVIEDVGAVTYNYSRATSLFNLNADSKVFFVQGAENDSYEIVFGDGVTGRRPKDNSTIAIEYRLSNGELPNGCKEFTPDSRLHSESFETINLRLYATTPAQGGSVSESVESIKYNAPRHFTTQERAITTEDYENLLKINFPEINTVTAFGGEDLNPPQYGKVFVAVDLNEVDGLPESKKTQYYRFLKPRSPVSIEPVFVNPEYTYLNIKSSVKYNINTTRLTSEDIKTIVSSAILSYAKNNLNNFNRVFRYSKLVQAIDSSQVSIISNETDVRVVKLFSPLINTPQSVDIAFNIALDTTQSTTTGGYSMSSSTFNYKNQKAALRDDATGRVEVYSATTGQTIDTIGTIDYTTGLIQLSNFSVTGYQGSGIKIYVIPKSKEISTINNVILNILQEDIDLTIVPVRA